ncbi:MAG: 50S ribosomal protein L25/general stress protein Ctc [Holosporaceae bacterium]|nr:MAG: 50S ribosomal protein L25/general stress protein Ctc [Holosporaceae bacterium]
MGTGATRALRRTGHVPVSMYGKGQTPLNLSIEERFLVKEMKDKGFYSHLFEVKVAGKDQTVLVRDVQKHPVSDRPLHLDLLKVDASSVIKVDVAIRTLNEEKSPGIKMGGVMTLLRHDLPLLCSPSHIPEFIDIDLSGLKMGAAVHLEDLNLPEKVKVEHPEKIETLLTISQPRVSTSKGEGAADEAGDSEEKDESKAE